jgi:hypothetical protein
MSEVNLIINDIHRLLGELDSLSANESHALAVLRAENESLKTELNYLRNENITLRSNQ